MSRGESREPLPPSWFEKNVDTIVRGLVASCALLLVGDVVLHFVAHKHVHFDIEGWVGFYAVVGFLSYVGLVLTAKQLRKIVMRPLDFYGEEVASPAGQPPHAEAKLAPPAGEAPAQERRRESGPEPLSEPASDEEEVR